MIKIIKQVIEGIKDLKYGFWSRTIRLNKDMEDIISEIRKQNDKLGSGFRFTLKDGERK